MIFRSHDCFRSHGKVNQGGGVRGRRDLRRLDIIASQFSLNFKQKSDAVPENLATAFDKCSFCVGVSISSPLLSLLSTVNLQPENFLVKRALRTIRTRWRPRMQRRRKRRKPSETFFKLATLGVDLDHFTAASMACKGGWTLTLGGDYKRSISRWRS